MTKEQETILHQLAQAAFRLSPSQGDRRGILVLDEEEWDAVDEAVYRLIKTGYYK